jgi:hypothetical protein
LLLIRLLTLYIKCFLKLKVYNKADQINWLFSFKNNNKILKGITLRILYKRVKRVVSNKVIIIEDVLINMIKTVDINGKYKK